MSFKVRNIERALVKKGFERKEGKKHIIFTFIQNGERTEIYTFLSRGESEYRNKNIGSMCKQLKLSKRNFVNVIDCSWEYDDILNFYVTSGILP